MLGDLTLLSEAIHYFVALGREPCQHGTHLCTASCMGLEWAPAALGRTNDVATPIHCPNSGLVIPFRMSSPARGTPGNARGAVRPRYGITPINQGAVPPSPELLPLEDALVPSAQALSERFAIVPMTAIN